MVENVTSSSDAKGSGNHESRVFTVDWGLQVMPRFRRAYKAVCLFWATILLISLLYENVREDLGTWFRLGIWGGVASVGLALWGALFERCAQIEFRGDGVYVFSLLRLKLGYGRMRMIKYENCRVKEVYYWKFVNHYSLVFRDENRFMADFPWSGWEVHYEAIKEEIKARLPEHSYRFQKNPMYPRRRR